MVVLLLLAFSLAFGLLVLGPYLSDWIGSATGAESLVQWLWWTAQWPILVIGLLLAFATILYLGPDVDQPRWRVVTPGTVFAVVLWLAGSGGFALFVSAFGSYDKAWSSLAVVIVMLTWLWLSCLALLLGAEVNSEAERSRALGHGDPAKAPREG
jgi:membrane protein